MIFIQSLPEDSYFNVVSFGSDYEFMHEKSVKFSEETRTEALDEISGFKSNFGGTNLYDTLMKVIRYSKPI